MARKLRIAWSVGCGIVCLLLIVLWVRSHWRKDLCFLRVDKETYFLYSEWGMLIWNHHPNSVDNTGQSPESFHGMPSRVPTG